MRLRARPQLRSTAASWSKPVLWSSLALGLFACASTEKESVRDLVIRGQFEQAVELSSEMLEERPDNQDLQELHRGATVALLLDHGRRLTFADRDYEALALFEQAYALDPQSPQTQNWLLKTQLKLGVFHYIEARELHAEGHLVEAMEAYQQSLIHDAELLSSREGLARVFLQLNHEDGLAEDYYNEGVRNLRQDELQISRSRFGYSTKYRPGDDRASRRREQVEARLGRERVSSAQSLEEQKLYSAAEKEYAMALAYAPDSEEAHAGLERAGIEAQAVRLEVKATQMILRQEWTRAREVLEEALSISQLEKAKYEERITAIEEARLEAQYEHALDLEHDFRYADAIQAYGEILTERDFFLDARARIDTLGEYITRSAELYEAAEAATTPGQRKFFLLQIDLFWPEYEDIQVQLATLNDVEPELPPEPESEEVLESSDDASSEGAGAPEEGSEEGSEETGEETKAPTEETPAPATNGGGTEGGGGGQRP